MNDGKNRQHGTGREWRHLRVNKLEATSIDLTPMVVQQKKHSPRYEHDRELAVCTNGLDRPIIGEGLAQNFQSEKSFMRGRGLGCSLILDFWPCVHELLRPPPSSAILLLQLGVREFLHICPMSEIVDIFHSYGFVCIRDLDY